MGVESKIAWTDATINFWIGCAKVAQGCTHCYAETFAHRIGADVWGKSKPRRFVKSAVPNVHSLGRLSKRDGVRRRLFVSSLSDFFDAGHLPLVDQFGRACYVTPRGEIVVAEGLKGCGTLLTVDTARRQAWDAIDANPQQDYLILTKRPQNVIKSWGGNKIRDHVWLGVSAATDTEYTEAMHALAKLRKFCRFTFISLEPQIERVYPRFAGHQDVKPPDWVIVGGESGHQARPNRVAWIRKFVQARKAHPRGPRLFVKQLGSNCVDYEKYSGKGEDPGEWPTDLRIREYPGD